MKVRTLTAIIALLIFLPILLKGGFILMLFAFLLALIALKELLNMNMIKFLSIPGIFSAIALIIIMLPQDAGAWVQMIQLRSLIAMSFILLSYTVLSKHKLWPVISPNKTIEGFIGGLFSSLIVPLVMIFFVDFNMNIWLILLITIILSMFGQLGDLVESGFKRHFGVKDSGRILPGHGGILDRFDSFMFVLPLLNILLIQI